MTAAAAWMARFGDWKPMSAYLCACGHWHIGHRGHSVLTPKATRADVELAHPPKPHDPAKRCEMNCSKLATGVVATARGEFRVCDRHRERIEGRF